MSSKGLSCPACGREVSKSKAPTFPFCSERCRLLDLGKWLDGKYRVAGRKIPPEPEGDD